MPTPIGYLLVLAGIGLFLGKRIRILEAVVLSLPLFAVVVADFGGFVLRLPHYFVAILIARQIIDAAIQGERSFAVTPVVGLLTLFLASSVLSLFMPALLHHRVAVVDMETSYLQYSHRIPLEFRTRNLTQILYPAFMVAAVVSLRAELARHRTFDPAVYLFLAGFLVLLSGVIYQIAVITGGASAALAWYGLFSVETDVIGFVAASLSSGFAGIPRMFSFAGEPGYTGLFFVVLLVVAASREVGLNGRENDRNAEKGSWLKKTALSVAVAGVVFSASTTGYVGLVLALIGLALLSRSEGAGMSGRIRSLTALSVFVVAGWVVLSVLGLSGGIQRYLIEEHGLKLLAAAGSGVVRLMTIQHSLTEVFVVNPWLGVGYGSHRSTALLVSLLTNVGLLGTSLFLAANVSAVARGLKRSTAFLAVTARPFAIALAVVLPLILLAKSAAVISFGYYWLLLAGADASANSRIPRVEQAMSPKQSGIGKV